MTIGLDQASLILNYEVRETIAETLVYQWVRAADTQNNELILQILKDGVSKVEEDKLFKYFEDLQSFRGRNIIVPQRIESDLNHPLVLVYPNWSDLISEISLEVYLEANPEKAKELWGQAAEILHALHQREVIHGNINTKSFIVKDEKIWLRGFGYKPLIESGHEEALKDCSNFLVPEAGKNNLTKASDVYGFAQAVTAWEPRLKMTNWYKQTTNQDPGQRWQRMRDEVLKNLEIELDNLQNPTANQEESTSKSGSPLIPKFSLTVEVEPPGAGEVQGAGDYQINTEVEVKAIGKQGWYFHHWNGALNSSDNPARILMVEDQKVTAYFQRLMMSMPEEFKSPETEIQNPLNKTKISQNPNHAKLPFNWLFVFISLGILVGGGILVISRLKHNPNQPKPEPTQQPSYTQQPKPEPTQQPSYTQQPKPEPTQQQSHPPKQHPKPRKKKPAVPPLWGLPLNQKKPAAPPQLKQQQSHPPKQHPKPRKKKPAVPPLWGLPLNQKKPAVPPLWGSPSNKKKPADSPLW